MPNSSRVDALADRREIAVVIRLLLASHDELVYGEVVDVDTEQARRFFAWSELESTVQAVLRDVLRRPVEGIGGDERVVPH